MYRKNIKINLPKNVESIIKHIEDANGIAYVVGGCVRDSIKGKTPNDWDITTNLHPVDVKHIFKDYKVVDKGIDFGTIAVYMDEEEFEITTFRKDVGSKDCRHPNFVEFSNSIEEDLERRDFTINALAYNHKLGLVDCFNGLYDLENGIIRAVGKADDRFKEDALRMLRAIRLSAQHGFSIEDKTYAAIRENANLIANISVERFNKELVKILESSNPNFIEKLVETTLSDYMFKELSEIFKCTQDNPNHYKNGRGTTVGEHTMDALSEAVRRGEKDSIYNDLAVRLAILIHDFGKPNTKSRRLKEGYGEIDSFIGHADESVNIAQKVLKNLRFPNKIINEACVLAKHHDIEAAIVKNGEVVLKGYNLRKVYYDFGGSKPQDINKANDLMNKVFAVRICDAAAQSKYVTEGFAMMTSLEKVSLVEKAKELLESNDNILNIIIPINGKSIKDVLNMSDKDFKVNGKAIGEILDKIQKKVIKDNSFLDNFKREDANDFLFKYIKSMNVNFNDFNI